MYIRFETENIRLLEQSSLFRENRWKKFNLWVMVNIWSGLMNMGSYIQIKMASF